MLATNPHAVAARYGRQANRIVVTLNTGLDVSFSPSDAQGLGNASGEQLTAIDITRAASPCIGPSSTPISTSRPCLKGFSVRGAGWRHASALLVDDRAAKPRPRRAGGTVSSAAGLRRNYGRLIPPLCAPGGGKRKRRGPQAEPAGKRRWKASGRLLVRSRGNAPHSCMSLNIYRSNKHVL
jgi:hypothetical protein